MGSLIKKKNKSGIYYSYVESKRIDGKPKMVNMKYLGTAEAILEKACQAETPLQDRVLYSDVASFGDVALIYDIASRLGIVQIIDEVVPKRKQGASVGQYILTETVNRAVAPASTRKIEEWYSDTCLPYMTGIAPETFTPQNFWNNTHINQQQIDSIEDAILRKVVSVYDIDVSHIIYDATNFFTYIDTMQESELSRRGHSKEKRNDLRIVGLSLMVSQDCSIPLLHETYPGNRPDSVQFRSMMESLKMRYESITGKAADVTVVFDRGNNSLDNIGYLMEGDFPLHYVGGLKKNQSGPLFSVPANEYHPLRSENLEGQSAYRTRLIVYGKEHTAVVIYNPALEKGQLQGIGINRAKTTAKLYDIQQNLMRRAKGEIKGGKKPTVESVTKKVEGILKTEYMKEIFSYEVLDKEGKLYLTFGTSDEALEKIRIRELGKTALFTDRDDFTDEEIVNAYRSAWHVESAFRQMKNTDHLAARPLFHWTDEKIRVHLFTCVLAYRLSCLLVKELSGMGIQTGINQLLDEMGKIKRVETFFDDPKRPQKVRSFTRGSELSHRIEELYQLKEKYFGNTHGSIATR